jgi:hypothetical protein
MAPNTFRTACSVLLEICMKFSLDVLSAEKRRCRAACKDPRDLLPHIDQFIDQNSYASAPHPILLDTNIHNLLYFIQHDPLSGLVKTPEWLRGLHA